MADARRVAQVLGNLFDNAARHSVETAPILVSAAREGAEVAVSVTDGGEGIAPERLVLLLVSSVETYSNHYSVRRAGRSCRRVCTGAARCRRTKPPFCPAWLEWGASSPGMTVRPAPGLTRMGNRMNPSVLAVVACAGLLAACGGGSGGNSVSSGLGDLGGIRQATGLAPPVETPAGQRARAAGIVSRADSLILSTTYGQTSHRDLPEFRVRARCSGTSCSLSESVTGYRDTLRLDDLEFITGDSVAVGTGNGITLMFGTASDMELDYATLGGWMEHSAFGVQAGEGVFEGIRVNALVGMAGGDLTGAPLTGSATWLGLMVGMPTTGSARGDRLEGIAALNYDMAAGGGIDIAFSGIVNIDRRAPHSTPVVQFVDVPLGPRGTFEAGLAGNRVQGGLYGPNHAEAAGIFEQSDIVGAFGAKKQQ